MTTNGYLLTLDKLKKLVGLHISRYMITVDGLAETHDRQRPLIGNHGSWEQIIQNLRDAKNSDFDFSITIRTNFNDEIIKQARPYMEFLAKTFGGDQRFKYHFEAVKPLGGENDAELDTVTDESDSVYEISKIAREFSIINHGLVSCTVPFGLVCYAAKDDCLAVDSDGTIMKCTVSITDPKNHVGILANHFRIDNYKFAEWTSPNLPDACKECTILPICYGKKCPAANIISTNQCNKYIKLYEYALRTLYL